MTTITIKRALLERALNALSAPNHCVFSEPPICVDIRAALAAPATAPAPAPAWPTMPPRKGQSHVLFEDGYDEGWAKCLEACKAMFAAPATAPEFPANWARMIHYPECWDTAAYPELRDAIHEALAWSGCSVCKPAIAPAWHDAPTVPGQWANSINWSVHKVTEETIGAYQETNARWFGPIPKDKP